MSSEQAALMQQAEAEKLTLLVADNKTGYFGVAHQPPDGDHTYFFHVPSGMSTWTRPRYPSPSELATIKQKVSAADPAHVWECCREDGTLFYYNPFTGASQWTHPGPDAVVTFVDSSDDKDEAPGAPDDADSAASPLSGA